MTHLAVLLTAGVFVCQGIGLFALKSRQDQTALNSLLHEMNKHNISKQNLQHWFEDPRACINVKVIEKFTQAPEKVMLYENYRKIFIQPQTLRAGRKFLQDKQKLLNEIEEKYKVNREILSGILAVETGFGQHTGTYRVFNVLATQAIRMPKRSRWATQELIALTQVFTDDPLAVMGSYAGAVGLVQFIPSNILRYGEDWDLDRKINLDDWPDALASAANFLKHKGWQFGKPIDKGKPNYMVLWHYNPAHHYVKVVAELASAFGYKEN